jgi:hypothetical protein
MSVNLLPGIIKAAIVNVKNVIAVWTPVTSVPRVLAMSVIATFRLEPAKLQINWDNAKGMMILPKLWPAKNFTKKVFYL